MGRWWSGSAGLTRLREPRGQVVEWQCGPYAAEGATWAWGLCRLSPWEGLRVLGRWYHLAHAGTIWPAPVPSGPRQCHLAHTGTIWPMRVSGGPDLNLNIDMDLDPGVLVCV